MNLIIQAAIALVFCAAVLALAFLVRPFRFPPRAISDDVRVVAVISARGDAGGLEQAANNIIWLQKRDGVFREAIIADCGLTRDSRKITELLARDSSSITVCRPEDLPKLLEDSRWETALNTFK